MQARDRFLKNISCIFFIIIFSVSENLVAKNISSKLLSYNNSLKNSSVLFIQTNGDTIEEGIIYIGSERIRIEYKKPQEITIVLSQKKSMYVNHSLEETQYFNTKKSFTKVFFSILTGENFYEDSNVFVYKNSIEIRKDFKIDNSFFKIHIIYENNPINLRKIKVFENEENFDIGFFNHNNIKTFKEDYFSLIDPYLN